MTEPAEPNATDPDELIAAVRSDALIQPGRAVVVMLSGGRDSSCLLDVAVAIAGTTAVTALHVNYGLRDAAAADENYCAALCERLGVELTVRHPGAPTLGNLQAWARDARYGAAAQLATVRGGADVAAGHTATDQVETILYRLASSPRRRALLGMRAREGALIRPLLRFTRSDTAAYCRAHGLQWREDETNDSTIYARGRVRGKLVPALREIHPGAERNVLALAEILRDEAAVLDEIVDDILGDERQISMTELRGLPPALGRLVVQRLADDAAGRPAPGTARRLDDILALRDSGTGALDLPNGIRAVVTKGVLSFTRSPSAGRRPSVERSPSSSDGGRGTVHHPPKPK
jgi:tRNA(Ile)-lysidine synthase